MENSTEMENRGRDQGGWEVEKEREGGKGGGVPTRTHTHGERERREREGALRRTEAETVASCSVLRDGLRLL